MQIDFILQLYYFAVATEIFNIIGYTLIHFGFNLPVEFLVVISIANTIYALYILYASLIIKGRYLICTTAIATLSLMQYLFYGDNLIVRTFDSFVCISILIYYNELLYIYKKMIDKNKETI